MIQKCPICQGKGQVPAGFYLDDYSGGSTSTAPVTCRACHGSGVVGTEDVAQTWQVPTPWPVATIGYNGS